ncbi:MAG TPA: heparan-alpha-glucosaminide N-acetyltransferase domain-containing protein [Acidimicrobiia bacterium]|nr:heparan-alpha-glucosaminide N-acetyltransferase domain-containing protein [Acidimicrobiia bacterium]
MQPVTAGQRRHGTGRLIGVDAARALALIGMMSVHLLPGTDPDGSASAAYLISSGRASALFAVLAGVGLALANGATRPPKGKERLTAAAGIVGRAAVLGLIGLFLGDLDSGVAVILVNYAFLFVIAAAFIGMDARRLWLMALVWALIVPAIAFWLRLWIPDSTGSVPGFAELFQPVVFLSEVFLTGYYPVLPWIAYLLAGMAAGRSDLRSRPVTGWLLAGGVAVAVAAKLISAGLLAWFDPVGLEDPVQFFGATPTDSWWYLAVATPHSGTSLDLLHTIGTSLAVLGACLLLAGAERRLVAWLAAAGGMTLSLYSTHVLALTAGWGLSDRPTLLVWHIAAAIVIGLAWRTFVGRGPLETLAAGIAAAFKNAVAAGSPSPRGG